MSETSPTPEEQIRAILSQELDKVKKSVVETMMNAVMYKQQKIQDEANQRNDEYVSRFAEIDQLMKELKQQQNAMNFELLGKATTSNLFHIQN